MASELRVNTLKDASGNNSIATSFVAQGQCEDVGAINARYTQFWTANNVASCTDAELVHYTHLPVQWLSKVHWQVSVANQF